MALRATSDGILGRESGEWAREKLQYLSSYMSIVTTGMRKQWPRLVFVDLMAGPGRCINPRNGDEFDGSAILALRTKTPFDAVYLVEADIACQTALSARIASRARATTATVIPGDANDPAVIFRLRQAIDSSLALVFVDLIGQEIAFDTIRDLTQARNVDLLYTFPEMDLRRNAWNAPNLEHEVVRWTRFFGTDAWRERVRQPPARAMVALRDLYVQQLEGIGYRHHRFARLPMQNNKRGALYRPLFASRHPRGLDFFGKITPKTAGGRPLLPF